MRKLNPLSNQVINEASVEYFNTYVVKPAISNGMIPYYRDIPMGLPDIRTGELLDWGVWSDVNAMMQGVEGAKATYSSR
jgi:hypothetical protein